MFYGTRLESASKTRLLLSTPQTLTARSFEKITKGRPTLLMVYAESCPRCHEVLPVFRAIGDTFDKDPELLMAIIEGHDNEVPLKNVTLSSFPAIYYIEHDGQGRAGE